MKVSFVLVLGSASILDQVGTDWSGTCVTGRFQSPRAFPQRPLDLKSDFLIERIASVHREREQAKVFSADAKTFDAMRASEIEKLLKVELEKLEALDTMNSLEVEPSSVSNSVSNNKVDEVEPVQEDEICNSCEKSLLQESGAKQKDGQQEAVDSVIEAFDIGDGDPPHIDQIEIAAAAIGVEPNDIQEQMKTLLNHPQLELIINRASGSLRAQPTQGENELTVRELAPGVLDFLRLKPSATADEVQHEITRLHAVNLEERLEAQPLSGEAPLRFPGLIGAGMPPHVGRVMLDVGYDAADLLTVARKVFDAINTREKLIESLPEEERSEIHRLRQYLVALLPLAPHANVALGPNFPRQYSETQRSYDDWSEHLGRSQPTVPGDFFLAAKRRVGDVILRRQPFPALFPSAAERDFGSMVSSDALGILGLVMVVFRFPSQHSFGGETNRYPLELQMYFSAEGGGSIATAGLSHERRVALSRVEMLGQNVPQGISPIDEEFDTNVKRYLGDETLNRWFSKAQTSSLDGAAVRVISILFQNREDFDYDEQRSDSVDSNSPGDVFLRELMDAKATKDSDGTARIHVGERWALYDLIRLAMVTEKPFLHYRGSLPWPPCREGVDWYVHQVPQPISTSLFLDFVSFMGKSEHNSRPTVPDNKSAVTTVAGHDIADLIILSAEKPFKVYNYYLEVILICLICVTSAILAVLSISMIRKSADRRINLLRTLEKGASYVNMSSDESDSELDDEREPLLLK